MPDTAARRRWQIPWPSPRIGPLHLLLPPDYALHESRDGSYEDQSERDAFLLSTDHALGIWHAPAFHVKIDPLRGGRSWALHVSPWEGHPSALIMPPPILLDEYECSLTSVGGRVWNVVTYVTEAPESEQSRKYPLANRMRMRYALSAYSRVGDDLYLRAGASGWLPDVEAEALAVLRSISEGC